MVSVCPEQRSTYAINKRVVVLFGCLSFGGCAVRRYQPIPIVPAETASRFESRNLAEPDLQAYEEKSLGHAMAPWPPKTWDIGTLSPPALYFNPTLESARARFAEAQAAVVTAGARPNPSLSIAAGIPSPYLFNFDLAVPIETAGKRGHRIESARSLERAARFDLADGEDRLRDCACKVIDSEDLERSSSFTRELRKTILLADCKCSPVLSINRLTCWQERVRLRSSFL